MGQHPSKEEARLQELRALIFQANDLLNSLPRSDRTLWDAAFDHLKRLNKELLAIHARMGALDRGQNLPMPDPTPPFRLPPSSEPEAAATPALASACTVEPGTPVGSASLHRGQPGGSSSSEEGAHAGSAELSEVVPLLAAETGRLAPGLRRRQGHGEGS